VIPGLVAHGYKLEDAREYAVAACWEFLIPGRGMDVVNIGAVSFPYAVDQAIREGLRHGDDMEGILQRVEANIYRQVADLAGTYERCTSTGAFLFSFDDQLLERGRDLSMGAEYNNFGIHGAGSANAADALAAVRQFVLYEGSVYPSDLLAALDANYDGYENLRKKLAEEGPKVGNDDQRADSLMVRLFNMLADACNNYGKTARGGCLRPDQVQRCNYIWLTREDQSMREPTVGATAEGRRKGQPRGANLSPSQGALYAGHSAMLLSYSKIDYTRICNAGLSPWNLSDSCSVTMNRFVKSLCWCAPLPS
jgi:formate C-acetyltransferase